MFKILVLDDKNISSKIVAACIRQIADDGVSVISAGIHPEKYDSELENELEKFNISAQTVEFSEIMHLQFDLVIITESAVSITCPILSGAPPVLNWNTGDISVEKGRISDYYENVKPLVKGIFEYGFPGALFQQKSCLSNIIDSLHEGIIAHDMNRKIFLFSRGAEQITGASQEVILGRDCHELFSPHFCGEKCLFCSNSVNTDQIKRTYTTIFNDPNGKRKELEVKRMPMIDEKGIIIGAIAVLSDTTRVRELEMRLGETESFNGIIGQDHEMLKIFELIKDLSKSDFPVVISGESGTGKELVAAAIHNESNRRDKPFLAINCGALPEGTLDSELFGHVKGAFTGAFRDKKGRFEIADTGTLFLDEISELSLSMQVKLLRVLQEGVIEPVGSESGKKVDVRIICATNQNLSEMVRKGTFREDLYYRLAVVPVDLPPLRKRRNDIVLLANHFLNKISKRVSRKDMSFSDETVSIMMNYSWPGNVRQLQNAIQFALIKCREHIIYPKHMPPEILQNSYVNYNLPRIPGKAGRKPKLTSEIVESALLKSGGNKAKAARFLGVGRATLYNFLNQKDEVEKNG